MLTEVSRLVASEDLESRLIEACWRGCLAFKETWFSRKSQGKFF
jgi:hypothetical protein